MLCCAASFRLRHTFATSYHLDTSYHIEYITSCDISQSVKLREGVKNCEKAVTLTERGAQGVTHTHTHTADRKGGRGNKPSLVRTVSLQWDLKTL